MIQVDVEALAQQAKLNSPTKWDPKPNEILAGVVISYKTGIVGQYGPYSAIIILEHKDERALVVYPNKVLLDKLGRDPIPHDHIYIQYLGKRGTGGYKSYNAALVTPV